MFTGMIEYETQPWIVTFDGPVKAIKGIYRDGELSSLLVMGTDGIPFAVKETEVTHWRWNG